MYKKDWDYKYNLLIQYIKEYNGKYPKLTDRYMGCNLGNWVFLQRKVYNNGKLQNDGSIRYNSNILTQERIYKLNSIGFIWTSYNKEVYDNKWNEKYDLLKKYLESHNGTFPERGMVYEGVELGFWLATQRTIYINGEKKEDGSIKYSSSKLTQERIYKLNELGIKWVNLYDKDFNNIHSKIELEKLKRKILFKFNETLENSKNEIENEEDIKRIEEEFVRSLSISN